MEFNIKVQCNGKESKKRMFGNYTLKNKTINPLASLSHFLASSPSWPTYRTENTIPASARQGDEGVDMHSNRFGYWGAPSPIPRLVSPFLLGERQREWVKEIILRYQTLLIELIETDLVIGPFRPQYPVW